MTRGSPRVGSTTPAVARMGGAPTRRHRLAAAALALSIAGLLSACTATLTPLPLPAETAPPVSQMPAGHLSGTDDELATVLAEVGTYVRRFEQDFSFVISDERYEQHLQGRAYWPGASETKPIAAVTRRTEAEMAFLWLPDAKEWLGVRNVRTVDGSPVPDSEQRLERALKETNVEGLARLRQLRDESARFNIGQIQRNFSDPTLVLQFLDPDYQSHFKFRIVGREMVGGAETWKIGFEEQERPTLITAGSADVYSRGIGSGDLFSSGTVWVRPTDGTVLRTTLVLHIDTVYCRTTLTNVTASVIVNFRLDPKLEMWVPVRMDERYAQIRPQQTVTCVGIYSNFRHFEASGRLISDGQAPK